MEIWFSILTRQALRGARFTSPRQVREAIDRFLASYNAQAAAFEWRKRVVHNVGLKTRLPGEYMELEGRVAIVTGGAMGIGRGCAECLLRNGASVMIVDSNADAARKAAADLQLINPKVGYITADISNPNHDRKAVAATVERYGGLDVLVNNAGIQTFGDVLTTTEEVWDRTMNVNLKGHWLMSQFAVPQMLKRGFGSIVNISSVQGLVTQKNVLAYATSKHAMVGLTRSMAVDLASRKIRVNCVCPGTVSTPMIEMIIGKDSKPERLREVLNRMHPLGRIAMPREIGEVVAFLASERASFMTGAIVPVDGGLLVPIPGSPE